MVFKNELLFIENDKVVDAKCIRTKEKRNITISVQDKDSKTSQRLFEELLNIDFPSDLRVSVNEGNDFVEVKKLQNKIREESNATQIESIKGKNLNIQDFWFLFGKEHSRKEKTMEEKERNDIFISYAHHEEDKSYFDEIQRQLKTLRGYGLNVHVWDDTQIRTGDVWLDEIKKGLAKTKVAILLVSQNFLGSKFISETEIPAFLDMLKSDGGKLMPILLRRVPFQLHPILKNYQFLNANNPLNQASEVEKDNFYSKLIEDILHFYQQQTN